MTPRVRVTSTIVLLVAWAGPAAGVRCEITDKKVHEILADLTPNYLRSLPAGIPPELARLVLEQRVGGVPPSQLEEFLACFPTGERVENELAGALEQEAKRFETEVDRQVRAVRGEASRHIEAAQLTAGLSQAKLEREYERLAAMATGTLARLVEWLAQGGLGETVACNDLGDKKKRELPKRLCDELTKLKALTDKGQLPASQLDSAITNAEEALALLARDAANAIKGLREFADAASVPSLEEIAQAAGAALEEELLLTGARYRDALNQATSGLQNEIQSGVVSEYEKLTDTLTRRGDDLRRDIEYFSQKLGEATKPAQIETIRQELARLSDAQRGFLDASVAIRDQANAVFHGELNKAATQLAAYDPNQLIRSAFGNVSDDLKRNLESSFVGPLNELRAAPAHLVAEVHRVQGQIDAVLKGDVSKVFTTEEMVSAVGGALGLDPKLCTVATSIASGNWLGAATSIASACGIDLGGILGGGGGFLGMGGSGNAEVLAAISELREQLAGIQRTLDLIRKDLERIEGKIDYLIETTQENHLEVMSLLRDVQFDVETLRHFATSSYRPEEGACWLVSELPLGDPKALKSQVDQRGYRDLATCDDYLLRAASFTRIPGAFLTLATTPLEGPRRQYYEVGIAPPFRMLDETRGASNEAATAYLVLSGQPTLESLRMRINKLAMGTLADEEDRAKASHTLGRLYEDYRAPRSLIAVGAVERQIAAARVTETLAPLFDSRKQRLRSMECTRWHSCFERALIDRAPYSSYLWQGAEKLVRSALFQQQVLQGSVNLGHAYNALYGHFESGRSSDEIETARFRRYQSVLDFTRRSELFARNLMHVMITTRRAEPTSTSDTKKDEKGAWPLDAADWEPVKYAFARAFAEAPGGDARFLEHWTRQTGIEMPEAPRGADPALKASFLSYQACADNKIPLVGYESWYLHVPGGRAPGTGMPVESGACLPLPRAAEYTGRTLRESVASESLRGLHGEIAERLARLEVLKARDENEKAREEDEKAALVIAALRARMVAKELAAR